MLSTVLFLAAIAADLPKPMSDAQLAAIQTLALREENLKMERVLLIHEICESFDIPAKECVIDPVKKTVERKPKQEKRSEEKR